MTIFQAVPVVLLLLQIPLLALLFRRAHRLARGQGWCYRDLQRLLRKVAALECALENAQAERRALRDPYRAFPGERARFQRCKAGHADA